MCVCVWQTVCVRVARSNRVATAGMVFGRLSLTRWLQMLQLLQLTATAANAARVLCLCVCGTVCVPQCVCQCVACLFQLPASSRFPWHVSAALILWAHTILSFLFAATNNFAACLFAVAHKCRRFHSTFSQRPPLSDRGQSIS